MNLKKYYIVLILLFSVSCVSAPTPIPDSQSNGGMLYAEKCSVCHSVPHPKRHTYKQWKLIVPVMEKWMKKKLGAPLLTEDKIVILKYLKRNSS